MKYLMVIFVGLFMISCKPTLPRQQHKLSKTQRLINSMECHYHSKKDVCVCIVRDWVSLGDSIGMAIDSTGLACE